MTAPPAGDDTLAELVERSLLAGAEASQRLVRQGVGPVVQAARLLVGALQTGHKVLVVGNGGSAADAQHLAAELVVRFMRHRRPLPALALTTDTSILTAAGNDIGFEQVFARQVRALGAPGDVLVAISTSGASENIVQAQLAAGEAGMASIGLTGPAGGRVAGLADLAVRVPAGTTARVQECHLAVEHIWCEVIEKEMFGHEVPDASLVNPVPPGRGTRAKLVSRDALAMERAEWARAGLTVAWTNGCFDVLHPGHVHSLEAAARWGDVLVVGINSDSSARQLKGPSRPLMTESDRAIIVAALACVDRVVIFPELTPISILGEIRPDVHCKGEDYAGPDGMPEYETVTGYGGRVEFIGMLEGHSSSGTQQRMRP